MKKYVLFIAIISMVIYIVEPDYELKDFVLPIFILLGTYLLRWFMKK